MGRIHSYFILGHNADTRDDLYLNFRPAHTHMGCVQIPHPHAGTDPKFLNYLNRSGYKVCENWDMDGNPFMRAAMMACSISHYTAWKTSLKHSRDKSKKYGDYDIFVEQDLGYLEADHVQRVRIRDLDEHLEDDPDILYIGHKVENAPTLSAAYCTHAYVLKVSRIEEMLDLRFDQQLCVVDDWLEALYYEDRSLVHPALRHLKPIFKAKEMLPNPFFWEATCENAIHELEGSTILDKSLVDEINDKPYMKDPPHYV